LNDVPALQLESVQKSFGGTPVVRGISLSVRPGEFLTLLGPSGCGKTTTLNLIAGFLAEDGGSISINGRPMGGVAPFHRDIGLVFQDYALFPHRSVAENVAFGLRMRKVGRAEIAARVAEALTLVQLDGLADRRPGQLSGGQRQRVALARALVIRPALLLLDEPLSNLDLKLREDMRLELSALQRRLGITTILVTHDQSEALVMSDRVAVMELGEIAQVSDPATIYHRPADRFVATFIGAMNFLTSRSDARVQAGSLAEVAYGNRTMTAAAPQGLAAGPAVIAFRPESARLGIADTDGLRLVGRVDRPAFLGNRTELHLTLSSGEACVIEHNNGSALPGPGSEIAFAVAASDCLVFPA
jgi:putative spermidine/putrescine transport system ATP-binding protein